MFMTNELFIRENYLVRLSYEISSSHVWVSHVLREGLMRYILIFDNSIVGGWGDLNHGCLHWKHQDVPTSTQLFFFGGQSSDLNLRLSALIKLPLYALVISCITKAQIWSATVLLKECLIALKAQSPEA